MISPPVTWETTPGLVPYEAAVRRMEAEVEAIRQGAAERVWLLEHPPLYTAGTSADPAELIDAQGLPVYTTARGGRYTYHGPGQRIAYVLLDLHRRGADVRAFVCNLENWVIAALARFNVKGERRPGRIGIWVDMAAHGGERGEEAKIAAIGLRVRRWVTYHGVAINVDPDLRRFQGIVPCGVTGYGVTSLAALGLPVAMADLDVALKETFPQVFGSRVEEAFSRTHVASL